MMKFEEIWPEQFDQLSYTQWEIVFALSLEKKLLLYEASENYRPDRDEPVTDDDAGLQADFTAWLWGDGDDSLGGGALSSQAGGLPLSSPSSIPFSRL